MIKNFLNDMVIRACMLKGKTWGQIDCLLGTFIRSKKKEK